MLVVPYNQQIELRIDHDKARLLPLNVLASHMDRIRLDWFVETIALALLPRERTVRRLWYAQI